MVWLKNLRIKSANPRVRRRTVEKLAGSTNSHDTELLVASLEDNDAQVRCAAVRALEQAEDASCTASLLPALRDQDHQVRTAAAQALGHRGDRAAVGALAAVLSDSCPDVRSAAAGALRCLNWNPETPEDVARFEIAVGNARAAAFAGNAAVTSLVGELKADTSFHRRAAAEALKDVADPRRICPLLEALKDPVRDSRPGARNR